MAQADLSKMIDAIKDGNLNEAREYLAFHLTEETKKIIADEEDQDETVGTVDGADDTDKDEDSKKKPVKKKASKEEDCDAEEDEEDCDKKKTSKDDDAEEDEEVANAKSRLANVFPANKFVKAQFNRNDLQYISKKKGTDEFVIEEEDNVSKVKFNDKNECILVLKNGDEWFIDYKSGYVALIADLD